jgi:transketolase
MNKEEFDVLCKRVRNDIIDMSIPNGGHISTSFSCVEIVVGIYNLEIVNIDFDDKDKPSRDRFVLSKGHAETGFYAILANRGFFSKDKLKLYRQKDCYLGGHADHNVPGVELTTGALGHGLGFASGISYAAKYDKYENIQYVLLGDAECLEGSIWEAAFFAAKYKLNNLVAIIDKNNIGSLDYVDNFAKLEPFKDKWEAFGWEVLEIDGHDYGEIKNALSYSKNRKSGKPLAIIANTIKGKGVSFMENDPIWHVKQLNDPEEIKKAKKELM